MRRCALNGATPSLILPHKSLRPGARKRGPGGEETRRGGPRVNSRAKGSSVLISEVLRSTASS